MEIASGRKPIYLNAKEGQVTIVEWVWELYELGEILKVADPKLCGAFDEEQMERLISDYWPLVCSSKLQIQAFCNASVPNA